MIFGKLGLFLTFSKKNHLKSLIQKHLVACQSRVLPNRYPNYFHDIPEIKVFLKKWPLLRACVFTAIQVPCAFPGNFILRNVINNNFKET